MKSQYTLCQIVNLLLLMTVGDPNHPKSPHFYVLYLSSYLWDGWSYSLQVLHTESMRKY